MSGLQSLAPHISKTVRSTPRCHTALLKREKTNKQKNPTSSHTYRDAHCKAAAPLGSSNFIIISRKFLSTWTFVAGPCWEHIQLKQHTRVTHADIQGQNEKLRCMWIKVLNPVTASQRNAVMLGFAKMVEEKGFYLDSLKTKYSVTKDNYSNSRSQNISTKFSGPWTGHRRLKITKAESCPAGSILKDWRKSIKDKWTRLLWHREIMVDNRVIWLHFISDSFSACDILHLNQSSKLVLFSFTH